MSLSSAQFGNFRLYTIETGQFRLDGGAMFGVVPKVLWSRAVESDDKNRVLLTARCLLIHSMKTDRVYLVDTGIGHKFDKKFADIYGLDFSNYHLGASLARHNFTESDVTDVVFTHMHFDHCGGAVYKDHEGQPSLTFPNAKHWVHKAQWENVQHPNEREKPSFLPENIDPLSSLTHLNLIGDDHSYEPGFDTEMVNGHTAGQQLPLLSDGQRQLLFAADLLPTTAHLPLAWVMAFDTRPLDTLEEKKRILARCIRKETMLYLEHDPDNELIRIDNDPYKPSVAWSGNLTDL